MESKIESKMDSKARQVEQDFQIALRMSVGGYEEEQYMSTMEMMTNMFRYLTGKRVILKNHPEHKGFRIFLSDMNVTKDIAWDIYNLDKKYVNDDTDGFARNLSQAFYRFPIDKMYELMQSYPPSNRESRRGNLMRAIEKIEMDRFNRGDYS